MVTATVFLLIRSMTSADDIVSKQKFLDKMFTIFRASGFSNPDKDIILELAVSWIQAKDNDYLWLENYGYELLSLLAKSDPLFIEENFSPDTAHLILQPNSCVIGNIRLRSAIMSLPEANSTRRVKEILAKSAFLFVQKDGIEKISEIILALKIFPQEQDSEFAKCIVSTLADIKISKDTASRVDKIIKITEHWLHSEEILVNQRQILLMAELYLIMIQDNFEPSPAISSVLTKVDQDKLREGLKILDKGLILRVTQQLTNWLVSWPLHATAVQPHAIYCLQRLAADNKMKELAELAADVAPRMLKFLKIPAMQNIASVFFFLMISSHASDEPLKQVLPLLPETVKNMRQQSAFKVQKCLSKLAGVCFRLADAHPTHTEAVGEAFKGVVVPSQEELAQIFAEETWFSQLVQVCPPLDQGSSLSVTPLGPRGLNNLGNTCYMNSILQCLYLTPRFRRPVLTSIPSLPKELVLWQLQRLFALMSFSARPSISPNAEFITVVRPPGFTMGHQEDCSEFLVYILNTLHEQEESLRAPVAPKATTQASKAEPKSPSEASSSSSPGLALKRWTTEEDLSDSDPAALLNCKRKARSLATFDETPAEDRSCPPPAPAPPLTDVYSDSKDSGIHSVGSADIQEDEDDDGQQPESLVQKVFGGKQTTVYKCIDCDFEYKTVDKFLDLQLALPPKTDDNLNVKDLISYLLQPEELKGDNQYHCRSCNELKDATRTISIEKPPEHLILTLKRFHYEQSTNQIAKLMIPIECADNITLPTSKSSQEYELYGVVLHTGSTPHSGHYHSQAKSQQSWLWLNDEMVSSIKDRDIGMADTPYVLFYRQCNLEDPAQDPSLDVLLPRLATIIEEDNRSYQQDRSKRFTIQSKSYFGKHDNNQPPPPPPSGGCGENLGQSVNRFVC